jgi:hypothetical protein
MKKVIVLEVIVIIATLAVVLPLAFTGLSSYAGYNAVDWNNASRALTFNLQTGQTVTGSFSFIPALNKSYAIYNEDVGEIMLSQTSDNKGNFTFTAKTDGEYILGIYHDKPFGMYIRYSYSISAAPILGVDRTVLTGIVVTIGAVLALTIAVWNLRRTRHKKEDKSYLAKTKALKLSYKALNDRVCAMWFNWL